VTSGWQADPRFVDADYRLGSSSPAIDRGTTAAWITNTFNGAAPDIGRHER
jgi:hypothetical protein